MDKKSLPSLSIIIPSYNEELNLKRLFASLAKQKYPRKKIEYIFVDDSSEDNSINLAKRLGAKVLSVKTHDIEMNKGIGMHAARNELIYWMDADMEILSNNFFEQLVYPLLENKNILGSFTTEFALDDIKNVGSSLLRYLSYDSLQRDSLYRFFSPSIESTITRQKEEYFVCQFGKENIPPVGRILYRRRELMKLVGKDKRFFDLDTLAILVKHGYNQFAFVPKAKIRHYHAQSLGGLLKKRLRNVEHSYLPFTSNKKYTWFRHTNPQDLLKITFWVMYANLFLPEMLFGLVDTLRHKDIACLWRPVVSLTTTNIFLYGFLSNRKGRKFIKRVIQKSVM